MRPQKSSSTKKGTFNLILLSLVATAVCISWYTIHSISKQKSVQSAVEEEATPLQEEFPEVHSRKQEVLTPEMASLQLVRSTVAANKVAVFSKSYCPYCAKAKAALSSVIKPDQMYVVELDQRSDGDSIQDALLEVTGGRSVPRVFVNGNFIGGGDDTARKAQTGELKQLLTEAGVPTI